MLIETLVALSLATPPDTMIVPLGEVVVEGTRTRETVLRTPAAVTVVDRRAFDASRGIGLADALGFVPGTFVQSRGGAQDVRVTIRGFGARGNGERSNAGNIRGIRILTDGIPVTEPDGRSSLDLVDLGGADRIEVVRSNESVLYGNASGGVINVRTDRTFETPFAELRSRAGSFGYHREQAVGGIALGDARATVSLFNSTFDGWREHSQSTSALVRTSLWAPLGERTRLGVRLDATSNFNRFPGALTRAQADSAPRQANPAFVARDERRFNRIGRVALTLDHAAGAQQLWLNAFVEPRVLQRSERNRFRDFTRHHVGGSATWLGRTAWRPGIELSGSAGVDEAFQDGSILFYSLGPGGSRGTDLRANKREAANSAGGFLMGEARVADQWSLRLAARYDALWYIAEDRIDPALDADRQFVRWTPKASISRTVGEHTLYAALGGGVEAPAFNEIDPPAPFDTLTALNPFLDPAHSTTYEIGAKGLLASERVPGTLRYDVAAYLIEVRDDFVPFDGGAYFFTVGRSRRRGIEVGLDWLPVPAWFARASVAATHNRYVDYRNDLGDFGGRRMPGLPEIQYSASARYTAPFGASLEIGVEGAGAYFADDANMARVPAYSLVSGSAGYLRDLGERSVRAFVRCDNLADRRYFGSAFINGLGGEYFEPGLPRNWSAGLTLLWQ